MVTWNSINFDHPSVGILGIPKFMLISCVPVIYKLKLAPMINVLALGYTLLSIPI